MHFLNLINTAQCSENSSNSEEIFTHTSVIPTAMRETLLNETGGERIKRMFSTSELGISPELRYVIKSGSMIAIFAAAFGGIKAMKVAKEDFLRRNVASPFESQHLARRGLNDTMTLAAVREGFKSAVRYGSFSTFYLLGTMAVANYRNKISIWEHTFVASVLGGLSRLNFGVKGVLVAGALGGVLGFMAGGVITLSMRFSGTTLEELRYYQHEDSYARIIRRKRREEEKLKEKLQNESSTKNET